MSKETSRQFKLKRERAEFLTKLYYYTVLPFLFHHLFKVFYYLFRLLFLYPKFLKSSSRFEVVENLPEIRKDSPADAEEVLPKEKPNTKFDIHEGSFGQNRKILKKIPLNDEPSIKNKSTIHWFAKLQSSTHTIREIVTTGVFELLLGNEHAAKVRLMRDPFGNIYSISKLFENFETFGTIFGKKEKTKTGYHIYSETTENLEGYEEMLAVSLLLGRDDCHGNNWGVVKNGDRKLSATFDYGMATTQSPFQMYDLLKTCGHFHERIVSEKFLTTCETVIKKFEENHDEIEAALLKGIEAAEVSFWWWEVPTVNDIMRIFSNNKRQLKHLCHHIRAELAILKGEPESFRTALSKVDPAYKNDFTAMSLQRRSDFFVHPSVQFDRLIREKNGYSRVFLCSGGKESLPKKFENNGLYLLKTEQCVTAYTDYLHEQNSEKLHPKQVEEIQTKTKFPDTELCVELVPELSQQIISICRYPQERSPEIQEQLNAVYKTLCPNN